MKGAAKGKTNGRVVCDKVMTHGPPDSFQFVAKDRAVADIKKKIYDYLIEGAKSGLVDDALYGFIKKKVPKANTKRIVRAGFLALSEPELTDRDILDAIYALAIKHRLADDTTGDDGEESAEQVATKVGSGEKKKKK